MYPEILYKYRSLNEFTLMSMVNRSVWFSNPTMLNDPFDCQIKLSGEIPSKTDFEKKVGESLARLSFKSYGEFSVSMPEPSICYENGNLSQIFIDEIHKFKTQLENNIKSIGVLSFSSEAENTTMWSHYASDHTGICIGYKIEEMFPKHDRDSLLHEVAYYPKEMINFNAFDIYAQSCCNNDKGELEKIRNNIFSSKSDDWEYEKEWRMISGKPGNHYAGENVIYSIQFGLKCSPDMKATIRNILANVPMVFIQMVRSSTKLGLEKIIMTRNSKYWTTSPE